MKIYVINGPNMNMLGIREPEVYGEGKLQDLEALVEKHCNAGEIECRFFQSNHEGELVDIIQSAYGNADGIIINPAAYTHTSVAILDALKAVGLPTVEVHMTDTNRREEFRRFSYVSLYALRTVRGKGFEGYLEAVDILSEYSRVNRKESITDMKGSVHKDDLRKFFTEYPKIALAFSGGVDSSYLLYAAMEAGADVKAYYARSCFQPEFEFEDAKRLADDLGADMEVLYPDMLADPVMVSNPANRCYICKRNIMSAIMQKAAGDGYELVMDGTNASDDPGDRPGVKALKEMGIRSPLLEAGLTKDEIRRLSEEAGLFTWDKPAYSCLATRIQTGEEITLKKLDSVEACESYMQNMGFRDFRVRVRGKDALIQIRETDYRLYKENEEGITDTVKKYFRKVKLDTVFR